MGQGFQEVQGEHPPTEGVVGQVNQPGDRQPGLGGRVQIAGTRGKESMRAWHMNAQLVLLLLALSSRWAICTGKVGNTALTTDADVMDRVGCREASHESECACLCWRAPNTHNDIKDTALPFSIVLLTRQFGTSPVSWLLDRSRCTKVSLPLMRAAAKAPRLPVMELLLASTYTREGRAAKEGARLPGVEMGCRKAGEIHVGWAAGADRNRGSGAACRQNALVLPRNSMFPGPQYPILAR